MSDVSWPSNNEARLITEWAWDTASSYSDKQPDVDSRVPYRNVIECTNEKCGRIWISVDPVGPNGVVYKSFKPENGPLRLIDKGHAEATEWPRRRMKLLDAVAVPAPSYWPRSASGRPLWIGVLVRGEGWVTGDGDPMDRKQIAFAKNAFEVPEASRWVKFRTRPFKKEKSS